MLTEKVLIVDDDESIRELLRIYLEEEYQVIEASNGQEAVEKAVEYHPDLILLDIMLPVQDGWETCRNIRAFSDTPIIMISAKGESEDKIVGLELGADDYICKPFSPKEVLARVKAQIRRNQVAMRKGKETVAEKVADKDKSNAKVFGEILIDVKEHKVFVKGNEIDVTSKEYELLCFFTKHEKHVFTREQLLENVWGFDYEGDYRAVDSAIKRLRKKMSEHSSLEHIHTIRGVGYKFEVPSIEKNHFYQIN